MEQTRNRPSRPRLRSHGNSARVLIFDQRESEERPSNMSSGSRKGQSPMTKEETQETPIRPGYYSNL